MSDSYPPREQDTFQQLQLTFKHCWDPGVCNKTLPISMETNSRQFEELISTLEDLSETVRHVGIVAHDFEEQSQDVLNTKINDMVKGLQKLNDLKDNFQQVRDIFLK